MREALATAAPVHSSTVATPRLHHLDALRAGALLLGIVLHSIMPFLPGLPWLIEDSASSAGAWIPMFVIHLFRMSLFMMLAGYFGRMVLQRRGARGYLRDRGIRIGLPLLAFWPLAVGTLPALVLLGASVRGTALPDSPAPPDGVPPLLAFSPGQLWFLLLLLEIVLVVVGIRAILLRVQGKQRATARSARIGGMLAAPGGLLLAAVPYALGMLAQPETLDSGGIIEPTTLVPAPGASIAYSGAFLLGWFLHANHGAIDRISNRWILHSAVAVVLTPLAFVAPDTGSTMVVAVATALAGYAWVYALLGICSRVLRSETTWIRYLADASYWMYLLHLPLLVAIEIPLADLGWPIMLKLVVTWALSTAILLASYDLLVRSSWLGKWLNGRRRARVLFLRRQDPASLRTDANTT